MMTTTIRPAFARWPDYNRRLRDVIAGMSDEQLQLRPQPERWPLWATVGHVCCQRVFWLSDFAGIPGANTTPFTNASFECPGDDYLEPVMKRDELVAALDSTFGIVEAALDSWTLEMLDEEIRRSDMGPDWNHTRGSVINRVFSHDMWHCAELNETLRRNDLEQIDLWD